MSEDIKLMREANQERAAAYWAGVASAAPTPAEPVAVTVTALKARQEEAGADPTATSADWSAAQPRSTRRGRTL